MMLKCTVHTIASGHFTPYRKAAACMNHAVQRSDSYHMATDFTEDVNSSYTPDISQSINLSTISSGTIRKLDFDMLKVRCIQCE